MRHHQWCKDCKYFVCKSCNNKISSISRINSQNEYDKLCGKNLNIFFNNKSICESSLSALETNDVEILEYLLENPNILLSSNYRQWTPLHIIAAMNESSFKYPPYKDKLQTKSKKQEKMIVALFEKYCNSVNLFKFNADGFLPIDDRKYKH